MDAQFVPTALAGEITTSPETAALTVALLEDRLRGFVRDASGARATIGSEPLCGRCFRAVCAGLRVEEHRPDTEDD